MSAWVASQILFHSRQPIDFGLRNPASRVTAVNQETAFALGIEIPPTWSSTSPTRPAPTREIAAIHPARKARHNRSL